MLGGGALVTDTVNTHCDVLLTLSVALHCTCVVPGGKSAPDDTLQPWLRIPEPSLAEKPKAKLALGPVVGETVAEEGHVMAGLDASNTVTRNVHGDETLSALSVAVHVTGV